MLMGADCVVVILAQTDGRAGGKGSREGGGFK